MIGGGDFVKEKNDDYSSGSGPSFRDIPSDRTPIIEKIYLQVLNRKPSSRELSYYKYSMVDEDEIRNKLLDSDEHKKLLEDARELPGVKDQLKNSELAVRKGTQKVQDLELQIQEDSVLLNERNRVIADLRSELQNPYNLPSQIQKYEDGFDVYTTSRTHSDVSEKKKGFIEILKEFLNLLVK